MLNVRGMSVEYAGGIRAVRTASLSCAQGEIIVIVGSNGAGKSTLLRGISGFAALEGVRVTAEEATLDGGPFVGSAPNEMVARGLVLVPERNKIFATLTTRENLAISDRGGLSSKTGRMVMDLFPRLADRMSVKAGLLSGGERQMLAIGRALLLQPRFLLIDEVSLGLSPGLTKTLYESIRTIVTETSIGVIIVDEAVALAAALASRAYVMRRAELSAPLEPSVLASDQAFELIHG